MPQYFFHTEDGVKTDIDDEGTNLPSDADAINSAKELLSAMAAEKLSDGDHVSLSVMVINSAGVKIYTAKLALDDEKSRS